MEFSSFLSFRNLPIHKWLCFLSAKFFYHKAQKIVKDFMSFLPSFFSCFHPRDINIFTLDTPCKGEYHFLIYEDIK